MAALALLDCSPLNRRATNASVDELRKMSAKPALTPTRLALSKPEAV